MATLYRVFAFLCILYTLNIVQLVQCDQALGNRIAAMDLTVPAHKDRLYSGTRGAGVQNLAASFQIWVKGISTSNFDIVKSAINSAGCTLISSNINNQIRGLPHFGYVVARIKCGTQAKWQSLAYNSNFNTRVAFTERSYFTDNVPEINKEIPGQIPCRRMPPVPPNRMAIWQGKVNQHTLSNGQWSTDADGVSGADLDKLTYCRKFYPSTTGVRDYTTETISGWRDRGNTGGPYTRAVMTTECIQPVNNNCNYKRFDGIETPLPSEEILNQVHEMLKEYEINKDSYFPADFDEMTLEDVIDFEQRKPICLEPALERDAKLKPTGNETELELKRMSRIVCPTNPPPPPPYYPPPYYPPPPPSGCLEPVMLREQIDAAQTEEEKEEIRRKIPLCPNPPPPYYPPPPPYTPPPPTLPPYIVGFEQTINNQKSANAAWGTSNSRPWTNYMENMGWSPTVDYYNQIFGGNYYLLDLGVWDTHSEFMILNTYPLTGYITKIKKLPNMLAEPDKRYNGFMDPDALAAIGQDAYLEQGSAHGTANAAILVGNQLGLSRNIPLYNAKIGNAEYGVDMQAFQTALASVNELVISGQHARPSVVVTPINFNWSYLFCYKLKVTAVPEEAPCSMGVLDELATSYDIGIVVVTPSQNGFNHYDLLLNPLTGLPFTNVPYAIHLCESEPISAVPINICDTASRQHDPEFNVWDLYLPVHEKTTKKPFIVAAHNFENRIARWRNIQYSLEDPEWENPWWQIGSSNYGACVDFSSFGVDLSRSAANLGVQEDGHTFTSEFREKPYYLSGTSYATATAGAVALMKMGLYTPSYFQGVTGYNGVYVEEIRIKMKQEARYVNDDYDICRINYWQSGYDLRSFPRLKFF